MTVRNLHDLSPTMKRPILLSILCALALGSTAQTDSLFIRKMYDEVLEKGHAHENLRSLCKDIGARITGSAEAEMAIRWGKALLESYNLDTVYLQEFQAPRWERGTEEVAWITNAEGEMFKLNITALGGSEGTGGLLEGDIVPVMGIDEMKAMDPAKIKGKVVFFNRPFDQKYIRTFEAYGACADQRWGGTSEASKLGAKGVVIRSMATPKDDHPHTGSMSYDEGVTKIAGAAMSTNDADVLTEWISKGPVQLSMDMDCRMMPEITTYNVIGEIQGSEDNKIITFGGHLDSWDVGEGAHDDGAGIVHCIETIRLMKKLDYKPKHTLRVVLFMNEENGNNGGKSYAKWCHERGEEHIAALESDRGGFLPEGFDVSGSTEQVAWIRDLTKVMYDFRLSRFDPGYSGVDINPLNDYYPGMLQLGLEINSQAYFNYHHTEADVFEAVNKRELELGCAAMSSMIYLVDKYWKPFETEKK
jgi:hypothetical protein